jgi:8-oxo-dGTP pyrophosphatase MutT (NUDIX family)
LRLTPEALAGHLRRTLHPARIDEPVPGGLRAAAVLVPLRVVEGEMRVVLARRSEEVPHHKGQVCFPGGSRDAADADPCETALREAEEEMGIRPSDVELLGAMDAVHTVTGFSIRPVVALIPPDARFRLAPFEMAETFDVPLSHFLRFDRYRSAPEEFLGERGRIWFLDYGPHTIWGATARILHDLALRISAFPPERPAV